MKQNERKGTTLYVDQCEYYIEPESIRLFYRNNMRTFISQDKEKTYNLRGCRFHFVRSWRNPVQGEDSW